MKKLIHLFAFVVIALGLSCKKEPALHLRQVTIQLVYPVNSTVNASAGVKVKLNGKTTSLETFTDENGKATLTVPSDIYEVSTSDVKALNGNIYVLNGVKNNVIIANQWKDGEVVILELIESKSSQLIIKEIFAGGTPKDDGSGHFTYDSYIILYNNSGFPVTTNNLCIGTITPGNTQASNSFYDTSGRLVYENENWIPAGSGLWHFRNNITLQPGEQIVIGLYNVINNTLTHSKSINFDNPSYYAMYDMATTYKNTSYYVSPSASIPTSNYLKAIPWASGNAWISSVTSPGMFIFETGTITPAQFVADVNNNFSSSVKKIPTAMVLDGIESFLLDNTNNKKRFTAGIDAGYVYHTNKLGFSIYRNVDEAATLSIPENKDKIVYGYSLSTASVGGGTDPSGIDAEASRRKGARIVYKDTNNSSNDVHLRAKASLSNY